MNPLIIKLFWKTCLGVSLLCFLGTLLFGLILKLPTPAKILGSACPIFLALGLSDTPLKGFRYTVWILAAVTAAMCFPQHLLRIGPVNLQDRRLILLMVQMVMFGMGTQMSIQDFLGIAKMPKGVLIGILCQYTIMPLVGFAIAKTFGFPAEIAAGIILIGSCSSGLASNVMNYIAGANLALSVTLTAVAQLLAPLCTPLWMKILAGEMVEVRFMQMMKEIILMVLLPVLVAFVYNAVRKERWQRLHRLMPILSMTGIIYFTAVTTAAGRNHLLQIGVWLFLAAVLHNTFGYLLGYGTARLLGLDVNSSRTIAIEVGLQNGGMASGLAGAMGKLATVGLAAAIFSPWMNVSGSILANFWRKHPPKDKS
jgi:BASS family bile acid:Na+ symporter